MSPHETLIACADAAAQLANPDWLFVDCRYVLLKPDDGLAAYTQSHIKGAVYCHLDHDLSGEPIPGKTGRHPLPTPANLVAMFERLGIGSDTQVVAYDANNGVIASRLWWSLKWAGHTAVAVLDGGFARWQQMGLPQAAGTETRAPRKFTARFQEGLFVTLAQVEKLRLDPAWALIDVRGADRYRGEGETIDPVAGHIPGSKNLPFSAHLDAQGLHLPGDELRGQIEAVAGEGNAERTVFSCGSGVTATHAALMHMRAGLGMPKIYPGSFSEWIADGTREVRQGDKP